MGKKKRPKTKVIHHYHDGPNPKARNSSGVGPGRVTIETPGIDAETVKEIKNAAGNFADKFVGLVQKWAQGGGVDRVGDNIGKSLRAVQGVKAIPNAPIDVDIDEVSIDGTLLRPDEFIFGEKDLLDGEKYTWVWRNGDDDDDVAVHLTLRQSSLESTVTIYSTITDYTIAEAEHLAQMLLSACAFRMETEYKEIYRKLVPVVNDDTPHESMDNHESHVHEPMNGFVLPDGPVGGIVDTDLEDDDWDVKGVQG